MNNTLKAVCTVAQLSLSNLYFTSFQDGKNK